MFYMPVRAEQTAAWLCAACISPWIFSLHLKSISYTCLMNFSSLITIFTFPLEGNKLAANLCKKHRQSEITPGADLCVVDQASGWTLRLKRLGVNGRHMKNIISRVDVFADADKITWSVLMNLRDEKMGVWINV